MAIVSLTGGFFARDTRTVARDLLGRVLVSSVGDQVTAGRIVETEAYLPGDSCSHAYRGRTARNAAMFAAPGTLYVYRIYGLHHCANVATEAEGVGAAVLIRALEPVEGAEVMALRRGARAVPRDLCRGPGRLCVALAIDRTADGMDTCAGDATVRVLSGEPVTDARVQSGVRVGVAGLAADVRAALRFSLAGSRYLSR